MTSEACPKRFRLMGNHGASTYRRSHLPSTQFIIAPSVFPKVATRNNVGAASEYIATSATNRASDEPGSSVAEKMAVAKRPRCVERELNVSLKIQTSYMHQQRKKKTAGIVGSSPSYPLPRGPLDLFTLWLLHWVSALLIVFVLVTSVFSSIGLTNRVFGLRWTEIHLSAGLLILFFAIARLVRASLIKRARSKTPISWQRKIQLLLWAFSVVLPLVGLLIFQQPPLSKPVQVFGAIPFKAVFKLDHSVHMTLISFHKMGSYLLMGVLLVHIAVAVVRPKGFSRPPLLAMLWPWAVTRGASGETQRNIERG
jgi:cytochrome b561